VNYVYQIRLEQPIGPFGALVSEQERCKAAALCVIAAGAGENALKEIQGSEWHNI